MSNKYYLAGLVGTGRIGFTLGFDKKREQPASHTMALFNNSSIRFIAAADKNKDNIKRWQEYAKKHKSMALTFSSSKELYENVTCLDIITVAVNEDSHLEECLRAIEYGPKLVILEKPVALNTKEALKIKEAAAKHNVPVMVNHERRFARDYLALNSLIPEIGEIQSIKAELDSGLRVYGEEFEADGSYSLLHDGTHLVDIVQYILETMMNEQKKDGPLLKNPVITGIHKDDKNVIRNFSAHYTTEKVPDITIKMSGRSKYFEFTIEILGTLGKIVIGNGIFKFYKREESKLYTGFYSLTEQKVKIPKKTGYFSGMVQNAVDFLNGESDLISPLDDAIYDLMVLDEIKEQLISFLHK